MRLSKYYLPILKEVDSSIEIISHKYMIRAGLIKQISSGIYSWLSLGLRVIRKIEDIIRDEMKKIGVIEILMPCIQPSRLWIESGRYNSYGKEMLRIKDRYKNDMLFAPTHEEVVTDLIRSTVKSYRDLPVYLYQIQWKFRDEIRPRYGVIRSREFFMKDAYSFDINYQNAINSYELFYKTYLKIFKRMGLNPIVVMAQAGLIGGSLSHEFHILTNIGDRTLYYDNEIFSFLETENIKDLMKIYSVVENVYNPKTCPIPKEQLKFSKGIEIGHIFYFGDKYSKPMNAKFTLNNGKNNNLYMGSYGIGISRLIGVIIETFHDNKGIIWPEILSPFRIGLINLQTKIVKCVEVANKIYNILKNNNDILYDDTEKSIGIKFARMDLLGLPWQIIIGNKLIISGIIEVKNRKTGEINEMKTEEIINRFNVTS